MIVTTRQKYVTIVVALAFIILLLHYLNSYKYILTPFPSSSQSSTSPTSSTSSTPSTSLLPSTNTSDVTISSPQKEHGHTLDIIVSMFDESLEETASNLDKIRALEPMKNYTRIRTIIYVKDEKADLEKIKEGLKTPLVSIIPNRGRESGTYMSHIISKWNDLATHNMFVQAHMHHHDLAMNKLSDFLVDKTGFLNMGSIEICNCVTCHDPWSPNQMFPRLSELHVLVNQNFCPKEIAISYLAQFVVSKKRIHASPSSTYERIREVIESDMAHFIHSDPRQGNFEDKVTNPYFGHTMERAYPIIFKCESPTIAKNCGIGWEAMKNRREPGDSDDKCQCLDL